MYFVKPIKKLVLAKVENSRYTRPCPEKGAPGLRKVQVCASPPPNTAEPAPPVTSLPEGALGIPSGDAQLALQTDVCKEMVNKIAWVLGSTYRQNYSNMKTPARMYAWRIVKQVIKDHGYPSKISK